MKARKTKAKKTIEKKRENNATMMVAPNNQAKIRPLADRILIKEEAATEEKKTASGFIIPVSAQNDKEGSKRGVVVAVGPGRTEDGRVIAVGVKAGDTVLFQWGDKVKAADEEFYLVRESEILAIIK
jgi:chaperonin GroES